MSHCGRKIEWARDRERQQNGCVWMVSENAMMRYQPRNTHKLTNLPIESLYLIISLIANQNFVIFSDSQFHWLPSCMQQNHLDIGHFFAYRTLFTYMYIVQCTSSYTVYKYVSTCVQFIYCWFYSKKRASSSWWNERK